MSAVFITDEVAWSLVLPTLRCASRLLSDSETQYVLLLMGFRLGTKFSVDSSSVTHKRGNSCRHLRSGQDLKLLSRSFWLDVTSRPRLAARDTRWQYISSLVQSPSADRYHRSTIGDALRLGLSDHHEDRCSRWRDCPGSHDKLSDEWRA